MRLQARRWAPPACRPAGSIGRRIHLLVPTRSARRARANRTRLARSVSVVVRKTAEVLDDKVRLKRPTRRSIQQVGEHRRAGSRAADHK